jgi:exopolysaccharide biosynthesis WecB/TagA/CpsF family protein
MLTPSAPDACAHADDVPNTDAAPDWTRLDETVLGGVRIVTASRDDLVRAMIADHALVSGRKGRGAPRLVFDANAHALSLRAQDPVFRTAVDAADVIHADGGFLVTLSRFVGPSPIKERSATTDLIHDMARAAQLHGFSFYLLGGSEEINERAAAELQRLYPALRLAGRHHGYFSEDEAKQVVASINEAEPDIIWVGLGKPIEQTFCASWGRTLTGTWAVTCGGCFHFITGDYRRAPPWMQRANLEWLHRLISEPRRLFWRYATTSPHAVWIVFSNAWRRRLIREPFLQVVPSIPAAARK